MSCGDCKWFFPVEEEPSKGDCVQREADIQSEYWTAKPVSADAAECEKFEGK